MTEIIWERGGGYEGEQQRLAANEAANLRLETPAEELIEEAEAEVEASLDAASVEVPPVANATKKGAK